MPETALIFRPHRGLLADAMAEAVEVRDRDGLLAHLREAHTPFGTTFDPSAITLTPYGDDPRIGWRDTYLVSDAIGVAGFVGTVDR